LLSIAKRIRQSPGSAIVEARMRMPGRIEQGAVFQSTAVETAAPTISTKLRMNLPSRARRIARPVARLQRSLQCHRAPWIGRRKA
jgi:hypothetical protein